MSRLFIKISFSNGEEKKFLKGILPLQIIRIMWNYNINNNFIAVFIQSNFWDLMRPITHNCTFKVIFKDDKSGLDILRHDVAHIMAQAAKELRSNLKIAIGPVIKNGYYYDFHHESPFIEEDLSKIENYMNGIISRNEIIVREVWDRNKAIDFFNNNGESFKVDIINDLPLSEDIILYRQGNFIDLCIGPHLPSTGYVPHFFKLLNISGAYWRGDSKNVMLQRIYGTVWESKKSLRNHLYFLDEVKKRDHRKLGLSMGLFHQDEKSLGNIFWHNKGWILYRIIKNYIRDRLSKENYSEVKTPEILDRSLWIESGHWDKFRNYMFVVNINKVSSLAMKPMNCPCHIQIFKHGLKTYKDLPLRMSEFGSCYRNEPSGSLHGLFRLRSFVQDDAHIFCTKEQIVSETKSFFYLLVSIYKKFGFEKDKISINFSDRPKLRVGDDNIWDEAEISLIKTIRDLNIVYNLSSGEGAFYGPKIEFILHDAMGRNWQCGTLQADFMLPNRLQASYIGRDGNKHFPVMLHRAVLGSLERFIGILIEHYKGNLPLWLAPVQVVIATINSDVDYYAYEILLRLRKIGVRSMLDLRNEKVSYKIRDILFSKVPKIVVVGNSEMESRTVSERCLGSNEQKVISLDDWTTSLIKY